MSEASHAADREAEFERLVLPHRSLMMRSVWRVVRDPDLAEDAFQEALATLWRKLPAVSRHPNPRALILTVCVHAACDQLRARRRMESRRAPLDDATGIAASAPAETVEDKARVDEIMSAIGRLRRRQATAFLLRVVLEEPYDKIAHALRCSEVTARVHVSRAREKLRRWLAIPHNPSRKKESP